MPTQVDAPNGTTGDNNWKLWGQTSKILALATNDADTSGVWAGSGGKHLVDLYTFPALSGVADPVVSASLTTIIRVWSNGAGGQVYYLDWNSLPAGGSNLWGTFGKTYTPISYAAVGAELALAAVNGHHGMSFWAAGGPQQMAEVAVTQVYRTVDYNYLSGNSGEFAYMIGSLVGAFIGAGLLFREMPALARFIWRRAGWLIRPDEYEVAYRMWQEARCH